MASINKPKVAISHEIHPDWYYDIPVMKTLILGSYPPHEDKRDYCFYYPNTKNRFWKILSQISGCPLNIYPRFAKEAVEERHVIMKKLCAGVQNMGLEINRKGKSARDTDIEITKFQDIIHIIKKHKELKRILLPGYSATNSTFHSFIRYLHENRIPVPHIGKPRAVETVFKISINERILECHVLNSTSTAARIKFDNVLNQFKNSLL
jgi:G:T/U-mismatch repair DNA glycosylase